MSDKIEVLKEFIKTKKWYINRIEPFKDHPVVGDNVKEELNLSVKAINQYLGMMVDCVPRGAASPKISEDTLSKTLRDIADVSS